MFRGSISIGMMWSCGLPFHFQFSAGNLFHEKFNGQEWSYQIRTDDTYNAIRFADSHHFMESRFRIGDVLNTLVGRHDIEGTILEWQL